MKPKDVFEGQEVAMASNPKQLLGTVESIKDKNTVVVKFAGTESTAVYGIKVLVDYRQKGG